MESSPDHIAAGRAALTTAGWLAARAHFEAALKEQDSPEAHDGLGLALWWLNEIEAAHRHRAIAYVISPKTVEHHVSQVLGKLGLRSRAEAAAFAASGNSGDIDK